MALVRLGRLDDLVSLAPAGAVARPSPARAPGRPAPAPLPRVGGRAAGGGKKKAADGGRSIDGRPAARRPPPLVARKRCRRVWQASSCARSGRMLASELEKAGPSSNFRAKHSGASLSRRSYNAEREYCSGARRGSPAIEEALRKVTGPRLELRVEVGRQRRRDGRRPQAAAEATTAAAPPRPQRAEAEKEPLVQAGRRCARGAGRPCGRRLRRGPGRPRAERRHEET